MAGLMDELTAIKAVEDKITSNKVANFAYTDTAYQDPATYADGVSTYDPNAEQNIPVANASTLKVNATILTKGWRAQASAITRMLMNHFLGRISYNLNKVNDLFSLLLTKLMAYMGQPNGLATLNANGVIPDAQLPAKFVTRINNVAPDNNGDIDVIVGSNTVPITRGFLGAVFGRLLMRKLVHITDTVGRTAVSALAYAEGIWVCFVSEDAPWWSEDEITWHKGTGLSAYSCSSLVHANGLWVLSTVSRQLSGEGVWWSEDGKSWTQGTGITTENVKVYYANNLWLAVSRSSIWWSEDGKNWTQSQSSAPLDVLEVTFDNGLWLACGASIWWSEDGKNWTEGTGGIVGHSPTLPAYANGIWVAGTPSNGVWWSNDGKAWTQGTGLSVDNPRDPKYADGTWLVRTSDDGAWWSNDGKAWTQCTGIPNNQRTRSITFFNGIWLAGSEHNGAWWSNDGKVWTQITDLPTTESADGFLVKNGLCICIYPVSSGSQKDIYWSETGKQWEAVREIPVGASAPVTLTAYGNGAWLSVLYSYTEGYMGLYRSSIDDLIEDGVIDLGANIPLVTA